MAEKERWKNGHNNTNGYNNRLRIEEEVKKNDCSTDDFVETQLEEAGIVKALDGGYGWVVVFASFIANMVVDGVIFSISETIVPLWEKEFNTTTSMATVATSLLAGFYLLSGPLGSALANSFGCNTVAIAGSIIATSGLLLTVIVPALPVLYLTFGIIGGIGYGLIFLPAVVIVGQYFSERRALATGIAVCGSGIGTSLFSYLNPIILRMSNNNWRIFLVVIAGITLLCTIVGYFFKPLTPSKSQIDEVTKLTGKYIDRQDNNSSSVEKTTPVTNAHQDAVENGNSKKDYGFIIETTNSPHVTQGIAIERFEQPSTEHGHFSAARNRRHILVERPFLSTIELHANRNFDKADTCSRSRGDLIAKVTKASMADLNRPLSKMDVFYTGSVASLAAKDRTRDGLRKSATTTATLHGQDLSKASNKSGFYLSVAGLPSGDDYKDDDDLVASPKWTQGILASLRTLLDFSLLKSPSFLILAFSGFLTLACFFVPFMFISSLAKQNGIEESLSKYLVVILGIINLIGRVICGVISDYPLVDPLFVSNVAVIAGGLATALVPFCTKFWMFVLYCAPFALGVACFAALRSIICVELLGIEKLTNAYGMLMLFMGIAALIGPPFAALLKNLTNSFNVSFHVMGALMIMSGVVSLPLRAVSRYEAHQNDKIMADEHELEQLTRIN